MKPDLAIVRDKLWLQENNATHVDPQQFSEWVDKVNNDVESEDEARRFVLEQFKFNINKK